MMYYSIYLIFEIFNKINFLKVVFIIWQKVDCSFIRKFIYILLFRRYFNSKKYWILWE